MHAAKPAVLKAAIAAAKLKLINKPLPQPVEAQIRKGLPYKLRLESTRLLGIDYEGNIITAQVEVRMNTEEIDLDALSRDFLADR